MKYCNQDLITKLVKDLQQSKDIENKSIKELEIAESKFLNSDVDFKSRKILRDNFCKASVYHELARQKYENMVFNTINQLLEIKL
ncbi:MAG: hypothetical protein PHG08_00980 [Bacilli bacterium]|nr:hypothetical protein [Bacilli bacterium]